MSAKSLDDWGMGVSSMYLMGEFAYLPPGFEGALAVSQAIKGTGAAASVAAGRKGFKAELGGLRRMRGLRFAQDMARVAARRSAQAAGQEAGSQPAPRRRPQDRPGLENCAKGAMPE